MNFLPEAARTIGSFVLVLGVLVFIHEMGHYLAARWRGVHVEAFSIGFGHPLARWTDRVGTEWRLCWLPLGGYVKLHGQERPQDVPQEVRAAWIAGRTFHEKPVLSRAIVVAAGPIANFLLAAVLFSIMFGIQGEPGDPVVETVIPNSAAQAAGLQDGDRIASINDRKINNFEDIVHISFCKSRQGAARWHRACWRRIKRFRLHPRRRMMAVAASWACSGSPVRYDRLGRSAPSWTACSTPGTSRCKRWPASGRSSAGSAALLDWAVRCKIAQLSGQVAQHGFGSLVSFIALLSVNLGLINLFPIPILDGGHLVFYAVEAIRGRPLPPRALDYGFRAGLALIACIFLFVTWNDLTSFGLFRWVAGLIG